MNYIKFGTGNTPLVILPGLSVQSLLPLAEAIEKQYEIFESDPPDGYVITGDAKFYVKVDSLGVHLLVKKVQNGRVTFEGANTSRVGNVTLSTTDTAITFTVENTPGTELPAAGGSGTLLYSVLGAILIVFAGAALVVRMKRGRFCISDTFW